MPIYQYQCEQCGHRFDLRRDLDEVNKEPKCPKCGAERPRRVYYSFSTCSPGETCTPRSVG
jgi:putative FmdB family regulatory protein